ncbi:hypothetical protein Tco_0287807 [Tanacetum coccineum]
MSSAASQETSSLNVDVETMTSNLKKLKADDKLYQDVSEFLLLERGLKSISTDEDKDGEENKGAEDEIEWVKVKLRRNSMGKAGQA